MRARKIRFEFGSLHVVGKAPEGVVAPAHIGGILPGMAQTTQAGEVHVADSRLGQGLGQGFLIKLGIVPGARHGADIGDFLHLLRL